MFVDWKVCVRYAALHMEIICEMNYLRWFVGFTHILKRPLQSGRCRNCKDLSNFIRTQN